MRSIDIETGSSVAPPGVATAKFTPINIDEEMKKAVYSAAGKTGGAIKKYWQQKLER